MLILILIFFIVLTVWFEHKHKKDKYSYWDMGKCITLPFIITDWIVILILCMFLTESRVVDQKVALYEKQNKEIEEKIEVTVKQYMNFESTAYKDLKTESYINLVNMYPELKSDKLVQQQVALYMANNEHITTLKEEKINESIYKWWIYFGG